ncbi:coiled-coil domain-containing protein 91-like [Dendronephthya gigantea]|uniref:coiled-coil domain-containing protein 91-like n=1 Tax=Dendronephthya gigantea TaxID=151771 RepID=UPI00106B43FB|nr:coiled-coil domain-containing protein 91-like [Dendronephthya gigantea]
MADNWAAFKTSDAGKEGDDDWADFGGFESASPASNPFGNSSAASQGFPWATAFPASPQPALNTQATAASQKPAFPTSTAQSVNISPSPPPRTQDTNLLNDPGEYAMLSTAHSGIPGQKTTATAGSIQTPTGPPTQPNPLSGLPPQLTSSHGELPHNQQAQQSNMPTKSNLIPSNELFITQSTELTTQSAPPRVPQSAPPPVPQSAPPPVPSREHRTVTAVAQSPAVDETRVNNLQGELKEANEKMNDYQNKLHISEEKLSLAEREKIRLEESLEEMKKRYAAATDVAKEQYLEIEKQKEKYNELQDKHEDQLKNLREAGQEAFALIVEEYKELSKTAVAQEREKNEKHLQQVLEEEREKFTTFINQQGENLKLVVKEEQATNLKKLEEALEEQKAKHQAELQDCLAEERERGKGAVLKAVEEEQARGKVLTEELINEQKKEFESFIAEQKKIFEENLAEERKETAKKIEEVLKEEQERAKNDLDEAIAEERHKSRNVVSAVKEKTKEEMGQYIKEKEKADEAVRLRSYQSMELFLQGVQTQLSSLINKSDIPPSS